MGGHISFTELKQHQTRTLFFIPQTLTDHRFKFLCSFDTYIARTLFRCKRKENRIEGTYTTYRLQLQ